MTRQDQSVGEGAQAYQSGGSMTVVHGYTSDQMSDIMVKMATQLGQYYAEAELKFEKRIKEFREQILAEFAKPGSEKATEAFGDPDFQASLRQAQAAVGRTGSEDMAADMVQLLRERATKITGSRLANILNDAILISGKIGQEEQSFLAIDFIVKAVKFTEPANDLPETLNTHIAPFIGSLAANSQPFEYLQSLGCTKLTTTMPAPFPEAFAQYEPEYIQATGQMFRTEFHRFADNFPALKAMEEKWSPSFLWQSYPTVIGKAIGYAAVSSKFPNFSPIGMWVS